MARWVVDLRGTPVLFEPIGPVSFTLRSAGPDRAWRTADDVVLSGSETTLQSADTPRASGRTASPARRPPNVR